MEFGLQEDDMQIDLNKTYTTVRGFIVDNLRVAEMVGYTAMVNGYSLCYRIDGTVCAWSEEFYKKECLDDYKLVEVKNSVLDTTEPQNILIAMWKELERHKASWGSTHDGSVALLKRVYAKHGIKEYLDKNGLLAPKEGNNGRT
jgi:hypothetical protein